MTKTWELACSIAFGAWISSDSWAAELVYESPSGLGAQEIVLRDEGRRLVTLATSSNAVSLLRVERSADTNRTTVIPIDQRFGGVAWGGFGPNGTVVVQEPWGIVTVLDPGGSAISRQTNDWRVARAPFVVGDGTVETTRYFRALSLDSLHGKVVALHEHGFAELALNLEAGSELLNAGHDLYVTEKVAAVGFRLSRVGGGADVDLSGVIACKNRILGTTVLVRMGDSWHCLWAGTHGIRMSTYAEAASAWSAPVCLATFRDREKAAISLALLLHPKGVTIAYCDNDRSIDVVDIGGGGSSAERTSYLKPVSGMIYRSIVSPAMSGGRWMILQQARDDSQGKEHGWLGIWRLKPDDAMARSAP